MGIALSIAAAWIALALAWARLRRARAGPSGVAARVVALLRREPASERARLAIGWTAVGTWEGRLARAVAAAESSAAQAAAIDDSLAELEVGFETSRGWDRVVPRVALLGGLLAASVSVIRGGFVHAMIAAGIGALAGAVGAVLTRAARAAEAGQRARADELAQLFAGAQRLGVAQAAPGGGGRRGAATVSAGVSRRKDGGLGLDRGRRRR